MHRRLCVLACEREKGSVQRRVCVFVCVCVREREDHSAPSCVCVLV